MLSIAEHRQGVTLNSTVRFSPGCSVMRWKPRNCITGRVTDATLLMNVELRHLVAGRASPVLATSTADLGCSAGLNLRGFDAKVFKLERRVAQPEAEGIQRLARAEGVSAIVRKACGCRSRAGRRRSAGT